MPINWGKIRSGLEKYQEIMRLYKSSNISKNGVFQRKYKHFYKVLFRSPTWYMQYYQMLENLKHQNSSFEQILRRLKEKTGRVEASFASKMYATRNPDFPVIDKYVLLNVPKYMLPYIDKSVSEKLENVNWRLPYPSQTNRLQRIIELYSNLIIVYRAYIASDEGRRMIKQFDKEFPNSGITDVKKIDLILWQTRP